MEEKPEILADDIEILDFDDDIEDKSPEIEEIIIEDVIPEPEIIEIPTKIEVTEPIKEEVTQPKIEPIVEVKSIIEESNSVGESVYIQDNNVEQVSNTNLLNQTLLINNIDETNNQQSQNINTNVVEEVKIDTTQSDVKKEEVLVDSKITKEKTKSQKKGKIKWKSVILGILIFSALLGAIIALPFISDYVNRKENSHSLNQTNNSNTITEDFKSNIDVKKALEGIKEYRNYQYQNINTISTKDNTEQLMTIKNNYVYSFNETKFEIAINKTVADFTYDVKDYYEKLDDVYNLYINDITTKTYNKKNTTAEEFDNLTNMFPNMINYLINNYNISEEKLLKVGDEEHIDITLKVPKDIVNNMSVETDRIQNKIDSTKLEQEFIYVDLLFDEDKKLYKIEIEIEDKNASQEQLENSVESAILKYIFTDFNKTVDITLPSL